ncbi:MAG: phosphoribosylaminoimidazolesuccinocarboxamide synthase [Nitrospirae bacterium]|nr:phosphoribosylaminoimidazolesuccinocarboxamide synthase [Nitrospirota bacterium]MBI3351222.1 phosphoribosylaminoimidazolesuccinocarboxamide synthase [Nitrospirota bacterium]
MIKKEMIYEGKAKKLYLTDDPELIIQFFKDDATAFNALKKGTILNKGVFNNQISERLFNLLEKEGIPTHFVKRLNDREMLSKYIKIIPIEVVVRNVAAGSLSKRLGIEEGKSLEFPLIEFYLKNDALGDPLINDHHVELLHLTTKENLKTIEKLALKINQVLTKFFDSRNLILVDFKLEFGFFHDQIVLGDEICPDTCRLWDKTSLEKMDKDRFRRDMGKVEEAYQEVYRRVTS